MSDPSILADVAGYYGGKLRQHGTTPAGVDWRDAESQALRFEQLLRVVDRPDASLVDIGCGYGSLLPHMRARGFTGRYLGVDVAPEMVEAARAAHAGVPGATFDLGAAPDHPSDFAVASGIMNVRLRHAEDAWRAYVEETVATLDAAGRRGFAFNCLTSYSDADRMRPDLYYADPCRLFDLCKRRYSRHVALLHDYGLYEFTILVRKDG